MKKNCDIRVDSRGREIIPHGSPSFPCACYYSGKDQGHVPWHWHEEIELVYLSKGSLQCAVGSNRFLLQEGEALFVNAGVPHAYFQTEDPDYEEYDIVFHSRLLYGDVGSVFHEKYLAPLTQSAYLSGFAFQKSIPWHCEAAQSLKDAVFTCLEETDLYEFKVRQALTSICMQLWSHAKEQSLLNRTAPPVSAERIKGMLDYFHSNYQNPVSLEQLAKQANICKRECQRIFKSVLGLTPTQYFEQYRLSMAIDRLSNSNDSITEISGACGFQSPSYFTKLFREQFGCTPSAFRVKNSASE